jgi:hypothetical protein
LVAGWGESNLPTLIPYITGFILKNECSLPIVLETCQPDHPTSVIPATRQIHKIALTIISTSDIKFIFIPKVIPIEGSNMVSTEKAHTFSKISPKYELK